jgi:hypothetical protein
MGCKFSGQSSTSLFPMLWLTLVLQCRWRLVSYRQKLDDQTGAYQLELTIERVDGQVSMESVTRIPQPSQLDDWWLYKKLEAEKIRRTEGEGRLLES